MDAATPTTDRAAVPVFPVPTRRPVEILLVEDNPADVVFIREVARRSCLGGTLTVARDGEEALALLRGPHRPDLVLLDLNMPRLGGLEVLETIKSDPRLKAIPVIVLTSSVAADDVERAYAANVNAYIRKPVDLGELTLIVEAIDRFWCSVAVLPAAREAGAGELR